VVEERVVEERVAASPAATELAAKECGATEPIEEDLAGRAVAVEASADFLAAGGVPETRAVDAPGSAELSPITFDSAAALAPGVGLAGGVGPWEAEATGDSEASPEGGQASIEASAAASMAEEVLSEADESVLASTAEGEAGHADDGKVGFETQVLRPLSRWSSLLGGGRMEEAAQFSLDGDAADPCAVSAPACRVERLAAEPRAEVASDFDEGPGMGHLEYEYDILDYFDQFDQLPSELMMKLKGNLDMHERLVRQLCKRSELLRAKAQAASEHTVAGAEAHAPLAGACPPSAKRGVVGSTTDATEGWRKELRTQMAGRVLAAQEARLRLAAETQEAALKAKVEYLRRWAQEGIAAATKRAEREEEKCHCQATSAVVERERVSRHLESAQRELASIKAQQVAVEDETRNADLRGRALDRARRPRAQKADALRSELKAHRARAAKNQATEQRVRDLERELEATQEALQQTQEQIGGFTAALTPSAAAACPAAHRGGC